MQDTSPVRANIAPATGRGVRVAVIDSGINPHHSHVGSVAGGVHVLCADDGSVGFAQDWRDRLGHGTAIAGVLRAKAPGAELYSVRVFDNALRTQSSVVAAAIRWVADHQMHVANCSLSTTSAEHRNLLSEACAYAAERGVLLVASSDDGAEESFPASLPHVIAVAGDESCGWDEYCYCGEKAGGLFLAHPHPRPLPRLPQGLNLQGHSFAAAHIAARAVVLREQFPEAGRVEVVHILIANALPGTWRNRAPMEEGADSRME